MEQGKRSWCGHRSTGQCLLGVDRMTTTGRWDGLYDDETPLHRQRNSDAPRLGYPEAALPMPFEEGCRTSGSIREALDVVKMLQRFH